MRITAIDPPGKDKPAGIASYNDGTDAVGNQRIHVMQTTCTRMAMAGYLEKYQPDLLIVEPFIYRPEGRGALDLAPAEWVGFLKYWVDLHVHTKLKLSPASTAVGRTAFFGDDKDGGNKRIKQLGLWEQRNAPHGMDALRHLLKHLVFDMRDPEQMLLRLR
jgi:hypothetical protein